MRVLPINLSVAACHHGLLHIHPIDIKLPDCSAIAVGCDATKVDRPSDHHSSQPIACRFGTLWLCSLALQLRTINTGQPDLFSARSATGIAVVTALDGDAFANPSRSRCPQHQQVSQTENRRAKVDQIRAGHVGRFNMQASSGLIQNSLANS